MTPKLTDSLAGLHARFLTKKGKDWCRDCKPVCRDRQRTVQQLRRRGIVTVRDLVTRFAELPLRLKHSTLDLIALLEIRHAIPIVLAALPDPRVRLACASVLGRLGITRKSARIFLEIGRRELEATSPDPKWLEAFVYAMGHSDDPRAAELLVSIFERCDLPGSLRGDAGDKIGFIHNNWDRRTKLYRRCRDAVLRGLSDESVDVQFWSMYVIAMFCNVRGTRCTIDRAFKSALPRLRELAANDHRLAPGLWWPLSAEAEDAIGCIENGIWPNPDAAERWQGNMARGKTTRV